MKKGSRHNDESNVELITASLSDSANDEAAYRRYKGEEKSRRNRSFLASSLQSFLPRTAYKSPERSREIRPYYKRRVFFSNILLTILFIVCLISLLLLLLTLLVLFLYICSTSDYQDLLLTVDDYALEGISVDDGSEGKQKFWTYIYYPPYFNSSLEENSFYLRQNEFVLTSCTSYGVIECTLYIYDIFKQQMKYSFPLLWGKYIPITEVYYITNNFLLFTPITDNNLYLLNCKKFIHCVGNCIIVPHKNLVFSVPTFSYLPVQVFSLSNSSNLCLTKEPLRHIKDLEIKRTEDLIEYGSNWYHVVRRNYIFFIFSKNIVRDYQQIVGLDHVYPFFYFSNEGLDENTFTIFFKDSKPQLTNYINIYYKVFECKTMNLLFQNSITLGSNKKLSPEETTISFFKKNDGTYSALFISTDQLAFFSYVGTATFNRFMKPTNDTFIEGNTIYLTTSIHKVGRQFLTNHQNYFLLGSYEQTISYQPTIYTFDVLASRIKVLISFMTYGHLVRIYEISQFSNTTVKAMVIDKGVIYCLVDNTLTLHVLQNGGLTFETTPSKHFTTNLGIEMRAKIEVIPESEKLMILVYERNNLIVKYFDKLQRVWIEDLTVEHKLNSNILTCIGIEHFKNGYFLEISNRTSFIRKRDLGHPTMVILDEVEVRDSCVQSQSTFSFSTDYIFMLCNITIYAFESDNLSSNKYISLNEEGVYVGIVMSDSRSVFVASSTGIIYMYKIQGWLNTFGEYILLDLNKPLSTNQLMLIHKNNLLITSSDFDSTETIIISNLGRGRKIIISILAYTALGIIITLMVASVISVGCFRYARLKLSMKSYAENEFARKLWEGEGAFMDSVSLEQKSYLIPFENLVFIEKISEGSHGIVFKGKFLSALVAIKKLKISDVDELNTDKESFEKEAILMKSIRHPNVLSFVGFSISLNSSTNEEHEFIVTEFMENGSLYSYIKKNKGNISLELKLRLLMDVCKGMIYLHFREIIHRDLKLENILLDGNYCAKIADFGISRNLSTENTMTGNLGTLQYIAPEILKQVRYSEKCDVYSFAIIMYELLFECKAYEKDLDTNIFSIGLKVLQGLRPFIPFDENNLEQVKESLPSTMSFIEKEEIDKISFIVQQYILLMKKCWNEDQDLRPSFNEILQQLELLYK
ncbi:hypothetical protein ABK040_000874 [Willaertia magna]